MRLPGLKRARLATYWLRSQFVDSALILGYHRIADCSRDPLGICLTPRHFSEQLEILSQHARPISLQNLVRGLGKGDLPKRAVAVTFDDGYATTLYQAKPLLERYRIPATVFVASGYLNREFWWDEAERLLYSPERLPARLSVSFDGQRRDWSVGSGAALNDRDRLLLSLCDFLRPLTEKQRQEAMSQIRSWAGAQVEEVPLSRGLRSDELTELAEGELVEIGAHSVTHPILAGLSTSQVRTEIEGSKKTLEEILACPVSSFSYPNGSVSPETLSVVREAGFRLACTSANDVVWRASDRYQLPRFWVQDWEGEAFFRWLSRWLNR